MEIGGDLMVLSGSVLHVEVIIEGRRMITRDDILKTKRKDYSGAYHTTTYEVALTIGQRKVVPAELIVGDDEMYEHLAKKVLHHIYGDLREPVEAFIRVAKTACQTMPDIESVTTAAERLRAMIKP